MLDISGTLPTLVLLNSRYLFASAAGALAVANTFPSMVAGLTITPENLLFSVKIKLAGL
jgi:hypothetical protein